VQLLTEGTAPEKPTTQKQLDLFISLAKIPYTSFRDPDDKSFYIVDTIGAKHSGWVLERETRKIIFKGDEAAALGKLAALP